MKRNNSSLGLTISQRSALPALTQVARYHTCSTPAEHQRLGGGHPRGPLQGQGKTLYSSEPHHFGPPSTQGSAVSMLVHAPELGQQDNSVWSPRIPQSATVQATMLTQGSPTYLWVTPP